jgi:hypothetical protein
MVSSLSRYLPVPITLLFARAGHVAICPCRSRLLFARAGHVAIARAGHDCYLPVPVTLLFARAGHDCYLPVPVKETAVGLDRSESVTVSVAVADPVARGPKDTVTVHAVPPASALPHVLLVIVKSPALAPLI